MHTTINFAGGGTLNNNKLLANMTLILRKVRFMFVRTFIEQPDNKFFLSAARGAKPRSAGYPTPQKKADKT